MIKYCELYLTTRKVLKGERNNITPRYEYSWHIFSREEGKFVELQSSYETTEDESEHTYPSREVAIQNGKEAIQDHYV